MTRPLDQQLVPALLEAFDLGSTGLLSADPVARGRLGAIWRLDTEPRTWAVKQVPDVGADELRALLEGAAFQEAVTAAGLPAPSVRRTRSGEVIADLGPGRVMLHAWVDLLEPEVGRDPTELGQLVAGLHQVEFEGTIGLDPWYTEPIGAPRWEELVSALGARDAPFADEVDLVRPDLLTLESLLDAPPRALRTCHRDLWADNVRRTQSGGLCVFDFDNAGLADPSQELAAVLIEYASDDRARAQEIVDSYALAGGPGRVERLTDFAMPIAQLLHILAEGCRRWLAATTDAERTDNEGWVREFLDRPPTMNGIELLAEAAAST
jgi:Ser/Thr protein kinase RdoA (MazF antagonist)